MNRIDTGLVQGKTIKDKLYTQVKLYSEKEQTILLDTIKIITSGLEKRRYLVDSYPESLLSGCFIISKRFKYYNISLTYSQEKDISSGYSEEEQGIPIEIPKKRIIRDLKEEGYNITFAGLASKAGRRPLHIKIIFNKEDIEKEFELKIYHDGVLFSRGIVLYPIDVAFDKIKKKSKEAYIRRKQFTEKLDLPHLEHEMKKKIVKYESGERYDESIEISKYEAKILDYLSELTGSKLRYSKLFKFGNFNIEDKQVVSIRLPRSELIEFPSIILNLEYLKRLDLNTNNISDIPSDIIKLKHLQELNFSENQILSLPESIGELQNLVNLYLSKNQIQTLPSSIKTSRSLRRLNLANNNIENIPEELYSLRNLEKLNIWGNNIKIVPEKIENLRSLKFLSFGNTNMTNIPYSISLLITLKDLILLCNDSSNLPENIGNLELLKRFELSVNNFSTLPESFGRLHSLETLSLYSRKGTRLPIQLLELESLKIIYFTGDLSNVITQGFKNDSTTEYILDELTQKGVGLYIP